jgi:hypothetical protein
LYSCESSKFLFSESVAVEFNVVGTKSIFEMERREALL